MAFFQFRFPGKSSAAADNLAAAPGESLEVVRRRARHRLLGAVVLVFLAVVAFPLLFDAQPRPVAIDTPIVIPNRSNTMPLAGGGAVPAVQGPAKPLLSEAEPSNSASGKEEMVSSAALPTASAQTNYSQEPVPGQAAKMAQAGASADSPQAKTDSKSKVKEITESQGTKHATAAADDAKRAKTLLEGKLSAETERQGRHIVQVGAFADSDKVREVRRKLEQAGLKTYVQTIEGKDGKHTTRVRLGPFETHAEAEKAAARVRKLDLPAHLVTL